MNASNGLPSTDYFLNVVFGDFNNDGKLDLVCGAGGPAIYGIHAFIGDGEGNWVEQSNGLPVDGSPTDMEVGDFNNDGKLDIVAMGRVFIGNGGIGGAMTWTEQPIPGGWIGVAVGDMNNDGKLDVVASGNGIRVWTSNGIVPFVWTDSSGSLPSFGNFWGVALGDINNDGKLDIVAANNSGGIRAWAGNGGTGPSAVWTDATGTGLPSIEAYSGIYLGDVNNDGKLDIAAGTLSHGVKVFAGNGGIGGFVWTDNSNGLDTSELYYYYQVVLGDLNRDGNLDLVAGGGINVWEGNGGQGGSMFWTSAQNGLPLWGHIDVNLGDVNNDGKLDIAVTSGGFGVQVWLNNYPDFTITGYTSISSGLPTTNKWHDVIFGDINIDGRLDLAASSAENLGVRVWTGNSAMTWTLASTGLPTTGNYNGLRFADIDHDGKLDLVGSMNGSAVKVWYGDGMGSWTETSVPSSTPIGGGLEVLDINHDGNDDIITCDYNPNQYIYVYLGNDVGGWGANTGPSETNGYDDVALGDINHDGNLDIISTSMNGSVETRFWLGDGSGTVWTIQSPGIPTIDVYLGVALADVNNDGNLDAGLAGFAGSSRIAVYTSDGGAGGSVDWTSQSSGLPTINGFAGVEFGDLDLDGNLDIVYANRTGGIEARRGNGGLGGSMLWADVWLPDLPVTGNYWGIALGDVNNDGKLEIGATKDNGVEVWKIETTGANQPPELIGGQVVPSSGNPGGIFTYNITYRDVNNDTPSPAPYVWISKSGIPYGLSPYSMIPQNWVGTPGNYSVGRNFNFSITLTDCGSDYAFTFNASDGFLNVYSSEFLGPLINCMPAAQYLGVQGYLEGLAGIGHITNHAPVLNWTYYDADGTPQIAHNVTVWDSTISTLLWFNNATSAATTDTYNSTGTAKTDLVDGNDYWLRVSLYDGFVWSDWNETQFHMNTPPPMPVEPARPHYEEVVGGSITLTWVSGGADAEADSVTYNWQLASDVLFTLLNASGSTLDNWTSISADPSWAYYWRVNATDGWETSAYGNVTNGYWNFTTATVINTAPEAQSLTVQGFARGTAGILNITYHTPELAWIFYDADGDTQTQYEVRVGTASGLSDMWAPSVQVGAIITVNYDFDGTALSLADATDYWFGVRVYDGIGWSLWNETRLHMNSIPPSPTIPNPSNGITGIATGTQTIIWNPVIDAEGSSLTYYWYVSTDVSFASVYDSNTTATTSADITTSQATTYYWRVRAYDGYEFGSNSTTWNFTTNKPPSLTWTGEANYENDGLHPESGDTTTQFTFRVNYTDEDNHAPGAIKVVILKDDTEIRNKTMEPVDLGDTDYTDSKWYMKTLQLIDVSETYEYYFYATDTLGATTVTFPKDAPDVTSTQAEGTITGRVTKEDGTPLEDAVVIIYKDGSKDVTLTDADGNFRFENLSYDSYTIKISKSGFESETIGANLQDTTLDAGTIKLKAISEFPWWLILVILEAIIIVLLIFFLWRKKKKDARETYPEAKLRTIDQSYKRP